MGQQSKESENPEKHKRNDLSYSVFLLFSIFNNLACPRAQIGTALSSKAECWRGCTCMC